MPPAPLIRYLAAASATAAGLTVFTAGPAGASRAPKVDQATLVRQAQAMLQQRSDAATTGARSAVPTRIGKIRFTRERADAYTRGLKMLAGQRRVLQEAGQQLTSARTQVLAPRVTRQGERAILDFVEYTTAVVKSTGGGSPVTMAQQVPRRLVFYVGKGAPRLMAEGLRTQPYSLRPFNDPTAVTAQQSHVAVQTLAKKQKNAVAAATDPKAADNKKVVAYAKKYWKNYNPAYRSFAGSGGDCTNFASQALHAGGWKYTKRAGKTNTKYWWYAKDTQSYSWALANRLPVYAVKSKRATKVSNPYTLNLGDILTADWDANGNENHSMIVTKVEKTAKGRELYLTYHTNDRLNYPFSLVVAQNPKAAYGGFHV